MRKIIIIIFPPSNPTLRAFNKGDLLMKEKPYFDFSIDNLPRDALVNDIVYNPIETDLLIKAKNRGNKIVNGLDMLIYQAAAAFYVWHNTNPSHNNELESLLESL